MQNMQVHSVTYNATITGHMYNPLKYVDPSGEQYYGWNGCSSYNYEFEMRALMRINYERYLIAMASTNTFNPWITSLYSSGNLTPGFWGGHGCGGGNDGIKTQPKNYNEKQLWKALNNASHGICVIGGLGSMNTCWEDDVIGETAKDWIRKSNDYFEQTGKNGLEANNIIDFITWNPDGKYNDYEASLISIADIYDCMEEGWVVAAMCTLSDYMINLYSFKNGGHYVNVNSCTMFHNGSIYIDFYDIPCNSFMIPYKSDQYDYFNHNAYTIPDKYDTLITYNRLKNIVFIRIKLIP